MNSLNLKGENEKIIVYRIFLRFTLAICDTGQGLVVMNTVPAGNELNTGLGDGVVPPLG